MRFGHISDIHWLDLSRAKARDFLNKRLSGGLNLLSGRAKIHRHDTTLSALDALSRLSCEHLIISGDLSNLSLPAEFTSVKEVIHRYFDDQDLSIVPGNHDYYTTESAQAHRFEELIYTSPPGNLDLSFGRTWPFVRLKGDHAFIGLNSAQARPWFVSAGQLGQAQCRMLETALEHPDVRDKFKVIVLHHHLFRAKSKAGESLRALEDRDVLLDICQRHQVDLICHGHNHIASITRYGQSIIAEAGSVSASFCKTSRTTGKFFIYETKDKALYKIEQYVFDCKTKTFTLDTVIEAADLWAQEPEAAIFVQEPKALPNDAL